VIGNEYRRDTFAALQKLRRAVAGYGDVARYRRGEDSATTLDNFRRPHPRR
jgi:hypothetical protein